MSRNASKIQTSIDALKPKYPDVNYHILKMDLSSQASVRAAAAELLSWSSIPTIDILINNAGIMMVPERTITDDGIEKHFATNHIGHFLLTCLIMPKLIAAAKDNPKGATRIVQVSSGSPTIANGIRWSDMNFDNINKELPVDEQPAYFVHKLWGYVDPEEMSYIPLEGYNQSKIANLLFGIGINARLYEKFGILSTAVHPGVIKTELARDADPETMKAVRAMVEQGIFKYKSFGAGGSTSLVAALDPKLSVGVGEAKEGKENFGAFMADCQISGDAKDSTVSSAEAEKLWNLSEKLVKEVFVW